jgi:iron complex outermembrane receptor protein
MLPLLLLWTAAAHDPPPPAEEAEVVDVVTERLDAGTRELDRVDVETAPIRSAVELLRGLPGMHLSAHGGRGKAWQFFYRGFDAEHGADIAVSIEGVPLNEPSNVHAHGYVDAELLPSLLVDTVRLTPGSDRAHVGAFGTAAAVDFGLGLAHEGLVARAIGGTDRSGAFTVAWRPRGSEDGTFLLAEADLGAGVNDWRSWKQARAAAGLEGWIGATHARLALLAYDGRFTSAGAVREDDLEADRVGFYQGYPNAGEGRSRRLWLTGSLDWSRKNWTSSVMAWAGLRSLQLQQNFTGWAQDADHGDATRQHHDATQAGLRAQAGGTWQIADHPWSVTGAAELSWDGATQTDDHIDPDGAVWAPITDGRLRQVGLAAWTEAELGWSRRLRFLPGLRVHGWWQAVGALEADPGDDARRWLATVSPRARLEARPVDQLTLFAGYGRGYRPPRASGGVLGALVRSDTVQGGFTLQPIPRLGLTATAFWVHLDDEQVFDHMSARFLGSGASRRLGGELLIEARPVPGLRLEGSVTFADGRYTSTGLPVPLAPRWMGSLSAGLHEVPIRLGAFSAGLRGWVLGPRPLPDGFTSRTGFTASALAAWRVHTVTIGLQVDNLFGNRWRDGEFVYASWWDRSQPRSSLPIVHVTAGTPTAARLSIEVRL